VTFRQAVALIRGDLRRRLQLEGRTPNLANAVRIAVMPGVVCVVAYRLSTWLQSRNHRILSRIIDDLQHLYSGIEIHYGSEIGPGLVLGDRPGGGVSEHVTMGRNCTLLGGATMTLNSDRIDLSKGRIVLGDGCVVGVNVRIIGAVTLGECTQIKANAVVLLSSPEPGGILEGIPARRLAVVPAAAVAAYNPLRPWRALATVS
jgi:serine O-acetyltransferase